MLIVGAELQGREDTVTDVRLLNGRIAGIGSLRPRRGEQLLDARGGALLPGLHDHHLHLMSYAASLDSLPCGPPAVSTAAELIAALNARPAGNEWIRGVGYHESVAGEIDRAWLDRHGPDVPVRIQHRSGRLWILNSRALDRFQEHGDCCADGRLYDQDVALRAAIGASLPSVGEASRRLAACGVTGITDMTPHNSAETLALLARLRADATLRQRVRLAGTVDLPAVSEAGVTSGETKVHLHETALPLFGDLLEVIRRSHRSGRRVAIHCVTEAELVFAVAALREARALGGDRIEHASLTPPALLGQMRELGLTVVTQPNFVAERGDAYLADVPAAEHEWLYRCRSFLEAGLPLAGGTDAPFGKADPWLAMRAAVTRRTRLGRTLGAHESLSPEQALALFTGAAESPARPRRLEPGAVADLCLLEIPWRRARELLSSEHVRATFIDGEAVWERSEVR